VVSFTPPSFYPRYTLHMRPGLDTAVAKKRHPSYRKSNPDHPAPILIPYTCTVILQGRHLAFWSAWRAPNLEMKCVVAVHFLRCYCYYEWLKEASRVLTFAQIVKTLPAFYEILRATAVFTRAPPLIYAYIFL